MLGRSGVTEGFRTPDLRDHNPALSPTRYGHHERSRADRAAPERPIVPAAPESPVGGSAYAAPRGAGLRQCGRALCHAGHGTGHDDEGGLSILDHGLQCADLLASERPEDVELQVTGLVHDLGWLGGAPRTGGGSTPMPRTTSTGERSLLSCSAHITRLVGGHVAAKRYLLATDPSCTERCCRRAARSR